MRKIFPLKTSTVNVLSPKRLLGVVKRKGDTVHHSEHSERAPCPNFLEHVASIDFRMSVYLQETTQLISLDVKY